MLNERTVSFKNVKTTKWQDPYGPSHSFFLELTDEGGYPKPCPAADYHAVRVLAGLANAKDEFCGAVPKMSNFEFGQNRLGFSMPWAWNKYLENRSENDRKYREYCNKEVQKYFAGFLKRAKLEQNLNPF